MYMYMYMYMCMCMCMYVYIFMYYTGVYIYIHIIHKYNLGRLVQLQMTRPHITADMLKSPVSQSAPKHGVFP